MNKMQAIKVSILGKPIPLKVKDSEVENTKRIAAFVDEKLKLFRKQYTNQPDSTLMILACLSITEELFELRAQLNEKDELRDELMDQINKELETFIHQIS